MRKGFAFPKDVRPAEPPPHRLEGSALAGKPEALRKSERQSRSERGHELLIWVALAKASLFEERAGQKVAQSCTMDIRAGEQPDSTGCDLRGCGRLHPGFAFDS
jgi:hypothetical protein